MIEGLEEFLDTIIKDNSKDSNAKKHKVSELSDKFLDAPNYSLIPKEVQPVLKVDLEDDRIAKLASQAIQLNMKWNEFIGLITSPDWKLLSKRKKTSRRLQMLVSLSESMESVKKIQHA